MLHRSNGSNSKGRTFHHRGINLDRAVLSQTGTNTSVKIWIIFKDNNSIDNRIERRSVFPQDFPASLKSLLQAIGTGSVQVWRWCTRTAVNDEAGLHTGVSVRKSG